MSEKSGKFKKKMNVRPFKQEYIDLTNLTESDVEEFKKIVHKNKDKWLNLLK